MKITYGRTAYVLETGLEMTGLLISYLDAWADGGENVCVNYEGLVSWLEEFDAEHTAREDRLSETEGKIAIFIRKVIDEIKGNVGDVIFSK